MKKLVLIFGMICIALAAGIVGYFAAIYSGSDPDGSVLFTPEVQDKDDDVIVQSRSLADLRLDSEPQGIDIVLDDEKTGYKTPHLFALLEPGEHRVRLVSVTVYSWSADIQLQAGEIAELKAQLVPKVGQGVSDLRTTDSSDEQADEQIDPEIETLAVVSSDPAAGEQVEGIEIGISSNEAFEIGITFDQSLDPVSAIKSNFSVIDKSSGQDILSEVNYVIGSQEIILKVIPAVAIYPDNTYEVTAKKELKSQNGSLLAEDIVWDFGT